MVKLEDLRKIPTNGDLKTPLPIHFGPPPIGPAGTIPELPPHLMFPEKKKSKGNKPLKPKEIPSMTERKIAIIGSAPDSCHNAPYDDPSWEIWVLNGAIQDMHRWDAVFDLHEVDSMEPDYRNWLMKQEKPVYLKAYTELKPDAVIFPKDDILESFPGSYYTNTVSWLLAYAITQRPQAVGLWGINMAHDTEYGTQRPSVEYFLGVAAGLGIEVQIPVASDLLKSAGLYCYDDITPIVQKLKVRKEELQAKINHHNALINDHASKMTENREAALILKGALEEINYELKNWANWGPSG